jgi:hypothetical protein
MTEEKEIATTEQPDVDIEEYRSRQQIAVMGKRIKALLPGGEELTDNQAMALGQYALVMDANPYRGEVYPMVSGGKFQLVEGYKLLVRWAKRQCPYTEKYEPITGIPEGAIGYRCYILRDDARPVLTELVRAGAPWKDAFDIAATSAVGVVDPGEKTRQPPKTWTWDQVARKRALKNAINQAYGMPSPREIAQETWQVNGVDTEPGDWQDTTPQMSQADRESHAEWRARARQVEETPPQSAEEIIDEIWGEEPEIEPPPKQKPHSPPSFLADTLDLVVKAGYVKDIKTAARRLGKSQVLGSNDAPDIIVGWAGTYDALRKAGKTSDESAAEADAELYAEMYSEDKEAS